MAWDQVAATLVLGALVIILSALLVGVFVRQRSVSDRQAAELRRLVTERAARERQRAAITELRAQEVSGADLRTMTTLATELVRGVLGAERCAVWEIVPRREALVPHAVSDGGTGLGATELALGSDALEARALRAPEGQAVEPGATEAEVAAMALALLPPHQPFGVLAVRFARPRRLSDDERSFLLGVASQLGAAAGRTAQEQQNSELQTRLQQMQRLESVGTLAGGVAHEFNNLLMVVLNHADLVLEHLPQGAPARTDIEQIQRAAWQAAELTRQLLIFSRREITNPQVLDVNTIVTSAERLLSRGMEGHVTLTAVLAPDLAPVKIDPARLEQALLNLAVNARDAMPSGGVLRIETASEDHAEPYLQMPAGRYVRLTVADTGVGMTKEAAERAFDPFFTTKELGRGTGLGLAIVYGIVKHAGGYVFIDSEPGQGTAVNVYLPASAEPVASVPAAAPRAADHASRGETILLVEDSDQLRELLVILLSRRGYVVLPAADGAEALRLERRHRGSVDLLLTDVVLPDLSGPQLAARLRRWHGSMKVLYISGYAQDVVETRGAIDAPLLQKPVTEPELLRAVREVLAGTGAPVLQASPGQLRVVIVEDHWLVAEALARSLRQADMSVVAIGRSVAEARVFAAEVRADVALVDYYLPDGTGADAARVLREAHPDTAIVVLTGAPSEDAFRRVVEAGACGYLGKTEPPSEIVAAVRKAAEGELLLDAETLRRLLAERGTQAAPTPAGPATELTRREQEVLGLIAEGLTNAAMAERLGVGVTTVRSHVRGVIEKLGVNSKLQAVIRAREQGLLNRARLN